VILGDTLFHTFYVEEAWLLTKKGILLRGYLLPFE